MSRKTMKSLYPRRPHKELIEELYGKRLGSESHASVHGEIKLTHGGTEETPVKAKEGVRLHFVANEWNQSLRLAELRSQHTPIQLGLSNVVGFFQSQIAEIGAELANARREIAEIKQLILESEDSQQPFTIWLSTLSPKPFDLDRSIPVLIEPVYPAEEEEDDEDCEYVATFVEANVGASGDTLSEAVNNLKDRMSSVYTILEKQESAGKIGKSLLNNFNVLKSVMTRVDDGTTK